VVNRNSFSKPFHPFFFFSEDEDTKSSSPNATVPTDNSTTTSGVLRSKDLRSVIETKRRNFSRSCSSSDSDDNGSNYDITRLSRRKHTRSPNSFLESESLSNQRGRSFSNIEQVLNEIPSSIQQQMIAIGNNDYTKRRSFSSRASSIVSTNRFTLTNANDDTDTSIANGSILFNDRTRSLSVDHRLTNQSQMSIASRFSVRFTTPRESTVFTKTDAPPVIRLLQQSQHHDSTDAIRAIIEQQRLQPTTLDQAPIIVEEDTSSKRTLGKKISDGITKSNLIPPSIEQINKSNGHASSSSSTQQHSVLSRLKYSLIKHQHQRKSDTEKSSNVNKKSKHSKTIHRACCTIS
jgi:SOS-response transcriptional repressor LexA